MAKYSNLLSSQRPYLRALITLILLIYNPFYGHADTITVHFLHGSKPARGHKAHESKWFGGLHGGHVTVQVDNYLYGFGPTGGKQVFSKRKKFRSHFSKESHASWVRDTVEMKYTSVKIPVSKIERDSLHALFNRWVKNTPHDYAFFGMRCASTAYCGLSKIGLLKKRSRFGMTYKYFYPKLLRKHLFKKAKKRKWKIIAHRGKQSRKWERD